MSCSSFEEQSPEEQIEIHGYPLWKQPKPSNSVKFAYYDEVFRFQQLPGKQNRLSS